MAGRRFTREQKIKIGREAIESGNASLVGRRYQIHGTVVARWARALQQGGEASFHEPRAMNTLRPDAEARMLAVENERLKKLLGEKDLEIAILKDLVRKTTFNSTKR